MTDNEIIKALCDCEGVDGISYCNSCPLYEEDNCVHILSKEAKDLINRQKAENERLQQQGDNKLVMCIANDKNKIKSEAIKEIAEQVKDYFREKAIETFGDMADSVEYLTIDTKQTEIDIDNIVKEMVGE